MADAGSKQVPVKASILTFAKIAGPFALAAALAAVHHIFYSCLSLHIVKPLDVSLFYFEKTLDPGWALTIGNLIAKIVEVLLAFTLGGVFVQIFWQTMVDKSQGNEVKLNLTQLNNILTARSKPWKSLNPALALVAICTLQIHLISTFASPALTSAVLPVNIPCDVPLLDLEQTPLTNAAETTYNAITEGRATLALITGSYMIPPTNPCGNCSYEVTYFGPSLSCWEAPVSEFPDLEGSGRSVFWFANAAYNITSGWTLLAGWQTINSTTTGPIEVVHCVPMNASYHSSVRQGISTTISTTVDILAPYSPGPLSHDNTSYSFDALFIALVAPLLGELIVNTSAPSVLISSSGSLLIGSSQLIASTGGWQLRDSLTTLLPSLMENLTISMLLSSGGLFESIYFVDSPQTCNSAQLVYVYSRERLWITYGVALGVTLLLIIAATLSWLKNWRRCGDTLDFARLYYTATGRTDLTTSTELVVLPPLVVLPGSCNGPSRPSIWRPWSDRFSKGGSSIYDD